MPFVSITRLRVRSIRFLPAFFLHARRTSAQAQHADGFLAGGLKPDRRWTFWTMTLWRDQAAMRAYIASGDHLRVMPKLMHWCDEASVVHWDQRGDALPDYSEAARRMRSEGRPSKLHRPSAHHADLSFAEPDQRGPMQLTPARRGAPA